jgi:hypothetical protein
MSLTEKYAVTVADIEGELALLDTRFKATRKALNSQLRILKDRATFQGHLVPLGPIAEGVTIASTEQSLAELAKVNSARARHLNALRRVLEDEAKEAADAAQAKLPLVAQEAQS